jgi:phage regulator Rha-like protein
MNTNNDLAVPARIENAIFFIRGHRVMLDLDLASLYGVPIKRLNEQVKRNSGRFPKDFMFRLTPREAQATLSLRSQNATLKSGRGRHRKYLPYVFTEHGALMAANILNSPRAVTMSVHVVRAFVRMRELLGQNHELAAKLAELDRRLTKRLDRHEQAIIRLLTDIRRLTAEPPPAGHRAIGFITAKR